MPTIRRSLQQAAVHYRDVHDIFSLIGQALENTSPRKRRDLRREAEGLVRAIRNTHGARGAELSVQLAMFGCKLLLLESLRTPRRDWIEDELDSLERLREKLRWEEQLDQEEDAWVRDVTAPGLLWEDIPWLMTLRMQAEQVILEVEAMSP
ncbi:hypothetical protein FGRMN_6633 [Fusarium graminum]|nr:hypothetical protein FGRMN_6633 [Fusarium graminum]